MSKNVHFPTLGPKDPQKPTNLHIFSNVGSIYQTKCVHSPNRNPQNYIFSPTQGPKGPQKNLQLTYILKCWQHISNKICSFSKQKPSKLHIFSKCWSIYPIKTFIPQVLASNIQYFLLFLKILTILQILILLIFSKYFCPQSRLSSKSSVLKVVCPQSRLSSMSSVNSIFTHVKVA